MRSTPAVSIHSMFPNLRAHLSGVHLRNIMLIALGATICIAPFLLHNGLFISHDINFHIFQASQFHKALTAGSPFPRWALDANCGFGSANFVFYSPLSYYAVSLFHLVIPSLVHSIIFAIWTSFFLSGLSMYLMAQKLSNTTIALAGALLYQFLPFHIITLHVRGGLAELFGFIWLPFVFGLLHQLLEGPRKNWAFPGLALSFAGLILSHLVSGFYAALAAITYLTLCLLFRKGRIRAITAITSLAFGLGVTSFYLLPIIYERQFVHLEALRWNAIFDYSKNYLFATNYAFSDIFNMIVPITVATSAYVLILVMILWTKIERAPHHQPFKGCSLYLYLFFFALFMATPASSWVWDRSQQLQTTQFPWRWVAFLELALVFLAVNYAASVQRSGLLQRTVLTRFPLYTLVLVLSYSSVLLFHNQKKENLVPETDMGKILNPEIFGYYTDLPREYLPIWASVPDMHKSQPVSKKISILSGDATFHIAEWHPENRTIQLDVRTPAVVRIETYYYPGWLARVNGITRKVLLEKQSGAMLIVLSPGKQVLSLVFTDTPLRKWSKYLSLFACLALVLATGQRTISTMKKQRQAAC